MKCIIIHFNLKKILLVFACLPVLMSKSNAQSTLPQVVKGKIIRIDSFASKYVTARNIDIWLPDNYSDTGKFAVLYMHDGQMLYDPSTTWNKQAWNIDDVASALQNSGAVKPFIVVGIWNGGTTRHKDYFPEKPFNKLSRTGKDTITAQLQRAGRGKDIFKPNSDNYLRFLVKELKPYIDANYAVLKDKSNTFIAGSSMGGLISIYAICEYSHIFGGAACLSTHWIGTFTTEHNPFPNTVMEYLSKKLPNPKDHFIYLDCGDKTLDALYPEIQHRIDTIMISKGYTAENWMTKYFPGEDHSEKAWEKRLDIPLRFLLKKQ